MSLETLRQNFALAKKEIDGLKKWSWKMDDKDKDKLKWKQLGKSWEREQSSNFNLSEANYGTELNKMESKIKPDQMRIITVSLEFAISDLLSF